MWDNLSMLDKAKFIGLAVDSGLTNLNDIKQIYNKYEDGGWLDSFLKFIGLKKEDRYKRVRENDSPTKNYSEAIENQIATNQKGLNTAAATKGVKPPEKYYIPYIEEKEITIPRVGRVSSNVLDSLAVNAERAGIPIKEALGLASIETKFGAIPNSSVDGFIEGTKKQKGRPPTPEEIKAFERAALNASFMRNYGGIYPQYLVNDHEWIQRGWEESPNYKDLGEIASPLEHAFTMYRGGIYNPGESNHTSKVKKEGDRLMSLPIVKSWYEEYKRNKDKTPKQTYAKGGEVDFDETPEGIATNAAIGLVPVLGTLNEGRQLIEDPSWEQAGWTAASLLGDIVTIGTFGMGEGVKAAISTAKATRNLSRAIEAYEQGKAAFKSGKAAEAASKAYINDVKLANRRPRRFSEGTWRSRRMKENETRQAKTRLNNNRLGNDPTYFQRSMTKLNNQERLNDYFGWGLQTIQPGLELWNRK